MKQYAVGTGYTTIAMSVERQREERSYPEAIEDEYIVSLRNILYIIQKRLFMIMVVVVGLTGASVGFSLAQTPTYEASLRILIGQERIGQERGIVVTPLDVEDLQQLTLTMAEAVGTRPVAVAAIRQSNLQTDPDKLLENLSVQPVGTTQFIEVYYKDTSPRRAQQVVNAVGEEFSKKVSDVSANASAVTATVWQPATLPKEPASPNFPLNIGAALVMAAALGIGLAFLLEHLDDTWRSPEEAAQISGLPTLGVIPHFKASKHTSKRSRGVLYSPPEKDAESVPE
jgi:capsular polysaccharide biosynthesis protein